MLFLLALPVGAAKELLDVRPRYTRVELQREQNPMNERRPSEPSSETDRGSSRSPTNPRQTIISAVSARGGVISGRIITVLVVSLVLAVLVSVAVVGGFHGSLKF